MLTRLCRFLKQRQPLPPCLSSLDRPLNLSQRPRGQVLVIFALLLVVLVLFIGLAVDAGSLYVTYGQLKRAVDAAAVSAANNFKRGESVTQMTAAAKEVLGMHEIDLDTVNLDVYICDENADGDRDISLQTAQPLFYSRCPDTLHGESPRKLVWINATQKAPVFFMQIAGFTNIPLTTNAIAEAAQVDVVVVMDVSESMGVKTTGVNKVNIKPDEPGSGCNTFPYDGAVENQCQPLRDAKTAAMALVERLYEGYDQIGVVSFDTQAVVQRPLGLLTAANKGDVETAIKNIKLHDDPNPDELLPKAWAAYKNDSDVTEGRYNPINPEDRDGDGQDYDKPGTYPGVAACAGSSDGSHPAWEKTLWDTSQNPYGWTGTTTLADDGSEVSAGGLPCDRDNGPGGAPLYDTYDWNGNKLFNDQVGDRATYPANGTVLAAGQTDADLAAAWMTAHDPDASGPLKASLSTLSTCTGCGLRVASNMFKTTGRPNAVWVMIVLSDGMVNMSDTPQTAGWTLPNPAANFTNGFCQGGLQPAGDVYWKSLCIDKIKTDRYCIDTSSDTCPPGATSVVTDPSVIKNYSVLDYAMDMGDEAGLTTSSKTTETLGNNIAIYSIYLDSSATAAAGEYLLRYLADVGDDGDRETQACATTPAGRTCGQYYYAPNSDQLLPIFENIASRIYTRITQ